MIAEPVALPPEVVLAPRAGALAPRMGTLAPEALGRVPVGEIPPLIVVPPPEKPETPEQTRPPETTSPPPPVIVNPPKVDEREPEEATRRGDRPPRPNVVNIRKDWESSDPSAPRYRPCSFLGEGGEGPSKPEKAPTGWRRCAYRSGRYEVILYDVRPKQDPSGKEKKRSLEDVCEEWIKRAEDHARSKDDALKARGQ